MATKKAEKAAPKKTLGNATKAMKRVSGDIAAKAEAKYVALAGRVKGATMEDLAKATPNFTADQVKHRVAKLRAANRIHMEGPRAKAVYRT